MVTENVTINVRETGTRVVVRKIEEIGLAANNVTRGLFLMQRAIYVLGAAGAVRGIVNLLDSLTNYENRLKLTTTSAANLEEVQGKLFDVAERSRTSFDSVSELYSRTALNVRALGTSQAETLRFTESLTKATIIGGSSAREANAAIIQLSQGLASNRLSGDELRSVLEQLPYAADIIAKYMDKTGEYGRVSRGELRQLGKEGKITAKVVLAAFEDQAGAIDELFARLQPTIGQALEVTKTRFLRFLDSFDDLTGFSEKIAKAILIASQYMNEFAAAAGLAGALALGVFGQKLVNAITAYIGRVQTAAVLNSQFGSSMVALDSQRVRSIQLQAIQAAQDIQAARARVTAAAANAALARTELVLARANATAMFSAQAGTFTANEMAAASVRLNIAQNNLVATQGRLAIQTSSLAGAQARAAGAATALTGAQARLNASTAASNTLWARFTARFPLLSAGISKVSGLLGGLFRLIVRNPIGALITVIAAAIAMIFGFGNEIKVTEDKVVGFRDVTIAAFQLLWESAQAFIGPITPYLQDIVTGWIVIFEGVIDAFDLIWEAVVDLTKFAFNGIIGIMFGTYDGVVAAWDQLPAAFGQIAASTANGFIAAFEWMAEMAIKLLNKIIAGVNTLVSVLPAGKVANMFGDLFGFDTTIPLIDEATVKIGRFGAESEGAIKGAADAFSGAFGEAMSVDYLGEFFDLATDRARTNIATAAAEAAKIVNPTPPPTPPGGDDGSGKAKKKSGAGTPSFQSVLNDIMKETELLKLNSREREIATGLMDIEDKIKRKMTSSEASLAASALKNLQLMKEKASILEEIKGPELDQNFRIQALNSLLKEGSISAEEFAKQMRSVAAATDTMANTLSGGIKNGLAQVVQQMDSLGEGVSTIVVGAFDSLSDTIVEFAKTGKLNMRQFFQDIFAQLLKLATNRLLAQLIGGFMGGGGGGFGLPGLATGGSILPSGPGNTDSQVVAFKKRPDERVDVLTPGQQKAQREAMNGSNEEGSSGGGSVNVNVAVVLSEEDVANAMKGQAGQTIIIKGIQSNSSTIRKILS